MLGAIFTSARLGLTAHGAARAQKLAEELAALHDLVNSKLWGDKKLDAARVSMQDKHAALARARTPNHSLLASTPRFFQLLLGKTTGL